MEIRDTSSLNRPWEDERPAPLLIRAAARAHRTLGRVARQVSPHWARWAEGMSPELEFGWGGRVWALRRGEVTWRAREGEGFGDNPRRNYNEAVERRQQRVARKASASEDEMPSSPAPSMADEVSEEGADVAIEVSTSPATPEAVDQPAPAAMDQAALEREVQERMGRGGAKAAEVALTEAGLASSVGELQRHLQAVDDVEHFDLIEDADEQLYQLWKALDYTLKNHKAAEAKVKLQRMFDS